MLVRNGRRGRAAASLLALVMLAGCDAGSGGSEPASGTGAALPYPQDPPPGAVLVHDVTSNRLVAFDMEGLRTVSAPPPDQTFHYAFPGRQDLYTSGSSTDLDFALLRVAATTVEVLAEAPAGSGLFPLASDPDVTLLLQQSYDDEGLPSTQQVVRLDGGTLTPLDRPGLEQAGIASGALLAGVLHYTVASDDGETFALRRLDLTTPGEPTTVRTGLASGRVDAFQGQLVLNGTPEQGTAVPCEYYCLFSDELGAAVSVEPNSDADLELTVLDPLSGDVFGTAAGAIVGFRLRAGGVEVLGQGLRQTVEVGA